MTISYVDSATNGGASGTAFTCSKPTGVTTGDVAVCVINYNGGSNTVADNNGATPFTSALERSYNTASATYHIFYRVLGASEPATYAFTGSASDRWSIIVSVYRGVDTTAIWDVAPSATTENETDSSSSYHASDALTTTTDNAMIITCGFCDSSSFTWITTPADSFTARQNNSGEQLNGLADKLYGAAGTQSAITWRLNDYFKRWYKSFHSKKRRRAGRI